MGAPTWPPYPPTLGASRGTRDAPRPYALAERGFGGGLAGAYAVGDADATIGGAGEVQPWQRGGAALDRLDARQMTYAVLWHRRRPARRAHQHRLGADAERLPQLAAGARDEARVVLVQDGGVQRAAHEAADQHVVRRRAPRVLHARERAGQERLALAARDHEAESVERMGHVGTPKAERDRRRPRVLDLTEQRGQRGVDVTQQPRGDVRLGGEDHAIGVEADAVGARHPPAGALALDGGHALAEHDRAVRQPVGERGDERLHAVGERDEEAEARAARPGLSRLREPATQAEDHRAVAALDLDEARQRRRHAELLGIGGIDARDQRLSDALERLGAEPAAHEGAEALVVAAGQRAAAARQNQVERHARLAAPGEE